MTSAERAYQSVTGRGYGNDDVSLLMSDETRSKYFPSDRPADTELGSKALEGTGAGAAIGGTVGGVLAAPRRSLAAPRHRPIVRPAARRRPTGGPRGLIGPAGSPASAEWDRRARIAASWHGEGRDWN